MKRLNCFVTVGHLDRELEFYTKVLPLEKVSESKSAPGAADELLGLSGTQLRSAELKLGDERITLTEHLTSQGGPFRRIRAVWITGFSTSPLSCATWSRHMINCADTR